MPKATPKAKGGKLDINKKVGPLPLWGWGAIVVGGFYVWRYMHPAASAPADAQGTVDNQTAGDSSLAPYAPVAGVGGGGFDSGGGGSGSDTGSTTGDLTVSGSLDPLTGSLDPLTGTVQMIAPKPRKRHHHPPPHPHRPHRPRHPRHTPPIHRGPR